MRNLDRVPVDPATVHDMAGTAIVTEYSFVWFLALRLKALCEVEVAVQSGRLETDTSDGENKQDALSYVAQYMS